MADDVETETEANHALASSSSTIQPTSSSVVDLYINLYYLHHSDGTNLVSVSKPLTESNYASWSQAMVIELTVKKKMCFVQYNSY